VRLITCLAQFAYIYLNVPIGRARGNECFYAISGHVLFICLWNAFKIQIIIGILALPTEGMPLFDLRTPF